MRRISLDNLGAGLLLVAAALGFGIANSGRLRWLDGALSASIPGTHFDARYAIVTLGLSVFFFLVGTELKRELTHGMFANRANLWPPVLAAVLGVALPALVFVGFTWNTDGVRGWPVPTATDLTFALALFSLFGRRLPARARLFLLAFAVIDDVIAVLLVTLAYSHSPNLPMLFGALVCAALFALVLALPGWRWLAIPLWIAAVMLTDAAGIEPALMAVWLGLLVPAQTTSVIERALTRPVSLVALPLFALQATAVPVVGALGFGGVFLGVALRPIAKFVGLFAGGFFGGRFLPSEHRLAVGVLARVASLGGIGFTVSLLVANLAFANSPGLLRQAVAGTFVSALATLLIGAFALAAGHGAKTTDGA